MSQISLKDGSKKVSKRFNLLRSSKSWKIVKIQATKRVALAESKRTSKVSEVIEAFRLVATRNSQVLNTRLLKTGASQRENQLGLKRRTR